MTEQPVEEFLSTEQTNTILANTPLNANDRCDGCSAQAYVLVATASGSTLLLCAHHFTPQENKGTLTIVRDDRAKLLARSEPAFTGV
jgi:hypothetical protein